MQVHESVFTPQIEIDLLNLELLADGLIFGAVYTGDFVLMFLEYNFWTSFVLIVLLMLAKFQIQIKS